MSSLRVALCQLNPTVGALERNAEEIIDALRAAERDGADIAVFGELAVCGYPPEDLLDRSGFIADCHVALGRIAAATGDCAVVVGVPELGEDGRRYNSAAVCRHGRVVHTQRKVELPTYAVFDEARWFTPGQRDQGLYFHDGIGIGISICEDVWLSTGPVRQQSADGARLLVNLNGSPFHVNKQAARETVLRDRVGEAGLPLVYVNQVGGQDELVFDGGSMVMSSSGLVVERLALFEREVRVVVVDLDGVASERLPGHSSCGPASHEEIWTALVTGTRDYLGKNGFTDAVVGVSGGIDSALVAAIAADAVGPDHVHAVLMPSRYSSDGSVTDALALAANLGVDTRTIPIEPAHAAFEELLSPSFTGLDEDLTEENLQSRIRGVLLMALSNKFGWIVLTTGNKSESAVGYSTLYGDTAGGLAVIKDVYKTLAYELCEWRNAQQPGDVVPVEILTKAPSAELRPDQRDDQSLPPYEVLDPILEGYIDRDCSVAELIAAGHVAADVTRVCRLVDLAEYKRRQTPPGIRITAKAFGRDRRLPMTNAYRPALPG